ncbi:5'/3'-nucleotidase SurE [uncultured Nitratireductor sp.]|uniref:5'/3'-nucleotidase SurE n=1 Tax=uncultured Nitratireductor sp. TaxID=520953 RepID=UPI0025EE33D8|nr:5'/3'-nucleotidase SurE [uncultured Nitratireductor sp.]
MRILLTNDDGIHAEGLAVLERIARTLSDDVWVVAPETDQSGFAHSLSLSEPLRMRKIDERHYALRGTPTDCVIMGVRHVMDTPPDLILSGVNNGTNIADDITYSGTVAGAMEGTLLGIPSFALSQAYDFTDESGYIPFGTAEALAPPLLKKLVERPMPEGVLINMNFPDCAAEDAKGTMVTAQGKMVHGLGVEERRDGRNFPYFWLRFGRKQADIRQGSDQAAIRDGYVSVTPLHLDLTAHEVRDQLTKALA